MLLGEHRRGLTYSEEPGDSPCPTRASVDDGLSLGPSWLPPMCSKIGVCCGLSCVPQSHMLKSQPPVPVKVTSFVNRVVTGVMS